MKIQIILSCCSEISELVENPPISSRWNRDNFFVSESSSLKRDVDPSWKLGGTSSDIKELPEAAKKASCPFSSLKSYPSGICQGNSVSHFPSLEETRTADIWRPRKRDDVELPSTTYPSLLPRLTSSAPPHPPPAIPNPLPTVLLALGSRKYRLSYSFEGAENRYGAFCARATREIPNRHCRSFSIASYLALAHLAARGLYYGGDVSK